MATFRMNWFRAAMSITLGVAFSDVREARAQLALGTAFTYQGSLTDGGAAASGAFDFEFRLYDDATLGNLLGTLSADDVASPLDDVVVTQGVFTTLLDFGAQFDGNRRWLEIGVRPGGDAGPGGFTLLSPRVELAAAPHALYALQAGNAATAGAADTATMADTATNAGNADLLDGMDSADFDADISNELNTGLSLAGTELRIGDAGGTRTASLAPLRVNRPPVAVLETDRRTVIVRSALPGVGAGNVELDLSLSYDPEGESPEFGFDFEGVTPGQPAYSASSAVSHAYTTPGVYLAEGWVRDSSGQYDVDKAIVDVSLGGVITVDGPGLVGQAASLAEVDGHPAISYSDGTNNRLKYARADDAAGANWTVGIVTVDSVPAGHTSLAVVNGRPAISYTNFSSFDLKYARADDADGASWTTGIVTVDSAGIVGGFTSLAVVNGRPAISYSDTTNDSLKYARADDADGASWTTGVVTVDPGGGGHLTSLAVVNGRPAISYIDGGTGDLKYARADDADGTSWTTGVVTVGSAGAGFGGNTSLAVVEGRPAISFQYLPTFDLNFARADDADGTSWTAGFVMVASSGDLGGSSSLEVVDGFPAIAYYSSTGSDLLYVVADDAEGTSWPASITVDSTGDVGQNASLAVVNGSPAIAYFDFTNLDLKYAR